MDQLKAVHCETAELCELQRACVEGFGQHVFSLAETTRAKSLMSSAEGKAEAARILDFAQSELTQAAPKINHCADAQGAIKRKYKL